MSRFPFRPDHRRAERSAGTQQRVPVSSSTLGNLRATTHLCCMAFREPVVAYSRLLLRSIRWVSKFTPCDCTIVGKLRKRLTSPLFRCPKVARMD
jgi:hypothetical protein